MSNPDGVAAEPDILVAGVSVLDESEGRLVESGVADVQDIVGRVWRTVNLICHLVVIVGVRRVVWVHHQHLLVRFYNQ